MNYTDKLLCNCAQCGREIDCGTMRKRKPARRISGRPCCSECFKSRVEAKIHPIVFPFSSEEKPDGKAS